MYAALDAEVSLRVYLALREKEDLTLPPVSMEEGDFVEICAPCGHAAVRAAAGAAGCVVEAPDQWERTCGGGVMGGTGGINGPAVKDSDKRVGGEQVWVRVTDVLAPGLLMPGYTRGTGREKQLVSLKTVMELRGTIIRVPATMLRTPRADGAPRRVLDRGWMGKQDIGAVLEDSMTTEGVVIMLKPSGITYSLTINLLPFVSLAPLVVLQNGGRRTPAIHWRMPMTARHGKTRTMKTKTW